MEAATKTLFAISGAMLALSASAAFAQIDLTWTDCVGEGGVSNVNLTCPGPPQFLYGSFKVRATTNPTFVAAECILDLETEPQAALKPFWHMETRGCNGYGLVIQHDAFFTACFAKQTPWGPGGAAAHSFITRYLPDFPKPGRARLALMVFRSSSDPTRLVAGVNYMMWRIMLQTGAACDTSGCSDKVVIAWNEAILRFVQGDPPVSLTYSDKGSICATVNGAKAFTCFHTPTVNRTWGQLKSRYR